ncbi:MAG: CapA family protein [Anaerolineales bacterium]
MSICLAACGEATAIAYPAFTPTSSAPFQTPTPLPTFTPSPSPPDPTQTPTQTQTPIPEITLLFTGDINPGRCIYTLSKAANDLALPYRALAGLLQSADIAIGSLDGAISDYNPPPPCAEFHRNLLAPAETVQGLQFAGFDVISVATNHAKDCGLVRGCDHESFLDTLKNLRAAGIQPTGGGQNLAEAIAPTLITVQGVRFAFLGFTAVNETTWASETAPGTGPFKSEIYIEAIKRAKERADVVVVLPQWGKEFSAEVSWLQLRGAQEMVDAGAALVVGNNPHRVQGVQTFPNGAVAAYALGNFVFDMEWSDGTLYTIQGVMLKATFRGVELQEIELIPIHIYDNLQPRLAPPEEAADILRQIEEASGR